MINYQIKLNLNTHRRWNQVKRGNPDLQDRMYRINADLGEEPKEMDDVGKLKPFFNNVQGWTLKPSTENRIAGVACVLLASSFYFERNHNAVMNSTFAIDLPGLIKCRMSNQPDLIRCLGRPLSTCESHASFVIENNPSNGREQKIAIPVWKMTDMGDWKDLDITMKIPGEDTHTWMYLEVPGLSRGKRRFAISGFPRILMRKNSISGPNRRSF